ncbi:hypothetical protein LP420_15245 [Massilia sp. B-10]|nr:hypothetical protein LP420_15245 [Massilia sp. B-10]
MCARITTASCRPRISIPSTRLSQPVWKEGSTEQRLTNSFVPFNAPLQQGGGRAISEGLSAELEWNLGPARLYYVGAHRSFERDEKANFYYGLSPQLALGVREQFGGDYRQDSHELRLATQVPWSAHGAGLSLYWFRERSHVRYVFRDLELLQLPPYYVFPHGPVEATGKAVFGQATYALSDRLRATAKRAFLAGRQVAHRLDQFPAGRAVQSRHRPAPAQRRRPDHPQDHLAPGRRIRSGQGRHAVRHRLDRLQGGRLQRRLPG